MSDTVKLIIEIPKDYYEIIKHEVDVNHYPYRPFVIIANGIPLDSVKAEFINAYPKNYADEPELGGASCHFSLNKVLQILDNISKESEDKK